MKDLKDVTVCCSGRGGEGAACVNCLENVNGATHGQLQTFTSKKHGICFGTSKLRSWCKKVGRAGSRTATS